MRLLLRADASAAHGYGHVVRAVAVAETARARGHEILMVGSVPDGWLSRSVDDLRVDWLRERPPWQAIGRLAQEWGADAVLVDSYEAPTDLRRGIDQSGSCLINLEDGTWGRRPADVVVDQTWGAESADHPAAGRSTLLRGSRFALVRAAVRRARATRAGVPAGASERLSVVVIMGGTDAAGALDASVALVVSTGLAGAVIAVAAEGQDTADVTRHSTMQSRVSVVSPGEAFPELVSGADLVVAAAGTTVTELCCIGVPMAIVPVVPNQAHVVEALKSAGAAIALDPPPRLSGSGGELESLMADAGRRARVAENALALVDGLGAARLLRAVERQLGAEGTVPTELSAREAGPADRGLLLEWRNDDDTRRWSRQVGQVSIESHSRWLDEVLAAAGRHLLIIEDGAANPVASVRWDAEHWPLPVAWEVSITLSPDERGRRISATVLAAAERWLREHEPAVTRLLATVHQQNEASRALFRRAGYAQPGASDGPEDEWLHLSKAL